MRSTLQIAVRTIHCPATRDADKVGWVSRAAGGKSMKTGVILGLGAGLAIMAALPAYSQTSEDSSLEAACRATETSQPASCSCTITKARAAGVSNAQLVSLFRDDGQSEPVDQASYGRFWQVKTQCIGEATLVSMGISAANPLPGVPAHMRPGMPLGGVAPAPAGSGVLPPAPPAGIRPDGPTQVAPQSVPLAAPTSGSSTEGSLAVGQNIPVSVSQRSYEYEGMTRVAIGEKYTFPNFDYEFSYDPVIRDNPQLFALAKGAAMQDQRRWQDDFDRPSKIRNMAGYSWSALGSLGRLIPIGISGYTNNHPQGEFIEALLWDADTGREVAWTDVFDAGLWNGRIRREYCTGLQAQRRERGTDQNTSCPDFDRLQIGFTKDERGHTQLELTALAYIAGSYAEGPYAVELPLDAVLLRGVREPYRQTLGASGVTGAIALRDRLAPIQGEYDAESGCSMDIYFLPANGRMPASVDQAFAHVRTQVHSLFATSVTTSIRHPDGWNLSGWKITYNGTTTVLEPVPGSKGLFRKGALSLNVNRIAEALYDPKEPSFGFVHMRLEIEDEGMKESFEAMQFGGC